MKILVCHYCARDPKVNWNEPCPHALEVYEFALQQAVKIASEALCEEHNCGCGAATAALAIMALPGMRKLKVVSDEAMPLGEIAFVNPRTGEELGRIVDIMTIRGDSEG